MTPHLEILPGPQRRLWAELGATPQHFSLYGGTALALHLGHRQSEDFDFFSAKPFDPQIMADDIPYLKGARLELAPNTINAEVDRDGWIKISLFGGLSLRRVRAHTFLSDPGIYVAPMLDIAVTKLSVIQRRSESKDYLDIYAMIKEGGIDLAQALAAAKIAYGTRFNVYSTIRTLCYFGDGDLHRIPRKVRHELTSLAAAIDPDRLPFLDPDHTVPGEDT